jgi:hypothetical protein
VADPDHKTLAAPKFNVLAVNQALGHRDRLGVVATNNGSPPVK